MSIDEHYRLHGALTAKQIEYLLAVHRVVKTVNTRHMIYELLPRTESQIFKSFALLQERLAVLEGLANSSGSSDLAHLLPGATVELGAIMYLVDEALTSVEESWSSVLDALPPAQE